MSNTPNHPNRPNRPDEPDNPRRSPIARRSRRDVNLSVQPSLNAIQREIEQARGDYQNQDAGLQSIYGGLNRQLSPLYGQYQTASAGIGDQLQSQLGEFSSMLNGQGLPTSEVGAATNLYQAGGNTAFNELASQAQRALGYDQSAMREGGLSQRYARQNLSQDLADQLRELRNRRLDVTDQMPALYRQREDELRQQQLNNLMVQAQIEAQQSQTGSNNAMTDLLMAQIQALLNPPRRGGRGRGNRQQDNSAGTYPSWEDIAAHSGGYDPGWDPSTSSTVQGADPWASAPGYYPGYDPAQSVLPGWGWTGWGS